MHPADRAIEHFASGLYCAESVLLALAEHLGRTSPEFPAIATGLCAGVSRTSGTCGALLGAIMGLGLALGREDPGEPPDPCFAAVQQLQAKFQARFGSLNCAELTGLHFRDEADRVRFREQNMRETKCYGFTREAVNLALKLMNAES